jgi:hypothetical protein
MNGFISIEVLHYANEETGFFVSLLSKEKHWIWGEINAVGDATPDITRISS